MAAPRLVQAGLVPGPRAGSGESPGAELGCEASPGLPASGTRIPERRVAGRAVVRSWPLMLLALPASVAVWSGWVGIGQLTGFGQVHPLPGIWNSLHIDSAVTLPVGVEAYAAYALHAWLAGSAQLTGQTRRFAKWSAIGSLLLGMAGQVAYHLLTQAGATRAPWGVTTAVACLPVLMLGMAAGLAHMIRADVLAAREAAESCRPPLLEGVADPACGISAGRLAEVRSVAARLAVRGQRVSRRNLRTAGVRGSNAELGLLARLAGASVGEAPPDPRQAPVGASPAGPG
jgi:hypothetical protein